MGQLFEWESPVPEADWNQFIIKRGSSSSGPFSTIATIAATDSDGYWVTRYWDETGATNSYYVVVPYNSSSMQSGSQSTPVTGSGITTTYTVPSKVAALMQLKQFGGDTRPTAMEVLDAISRIEDDIDYVTGHAWRERYSLSPKGDDTQSGDWEYHTIDGSYRTGAGVAVKLQHRMIRDLDDAQGDALEIWDGNQYVNYLTQKTEGRNGDWWLDNTNGTVYLVGTTSSDVEKAFRIKYRFGEQSVPGDIQELATKKVAIELAMSSDRSYLIPDGGSTVRLDSKVEMWERRVEQIIAQRTEISQFR